MECSEDRIAERFHASAVGSHLSELSGLNNTGVELAHYHKTSPRVVMEPQRSRTITPEPPSRTSHSPGSVSMSENFSVLDSLDTDRVCGFGFCSYWNLGVGCDLNFPMFIQAQELEELDHTRPPSPLGSTSSLSAPEWASDGYGSSKYLNTTNHYPLLFFFFFFFFTTYIRSFIFWIAYGKSHYS